ncbi:hypothetical protein AMTR_s00073p00030340 [Amborella trichopoda]|uniref:Uncharacterized protein n=1 Tax=Amborella trichopoda TaxID=13333 RepID=W1NNM0_AMBTC|nr:hypothetical protein AMTR_s00073p00030340 [Amborella trichopoda]
MIHGVDPMDSPKRPNPSSRNICSFFNLLLQTMGSRDMTIDGNMVATTSDMIQPSSNGELTLLATRPPNPLLSHMNFPPLFFRWCCPLFLGCRAFFTG